jgi:hypothetical protein
MSKTNIKKPTNLDYSSLFKVCRFFSKLCFFVSLYGCLQTGVNIKVLSSILGHKNIRITLDTYAHVLPDTKKENIMKIDEYL